MKQDDFTVSEKAIRLSYREAQILKFVRVHTRDYGRAPTESQSGPHGACRRARSRTSLRELQFLDD